MTPQEFERKAKTFLMWYAVVISLIGATAMMFILLSYLKEICA